MTPVYACASTGVKGALPPAATAAPPPPAGGKKHQPFGGAFHAPSCYDCLSSSMTSPVAGFTLQLSIGSSLFLT